MVDVVVALHGAGLRAEEVDAAHVRKDVLPDVVDVVPLDHVVARRGHDGPVPAHRHARIVEPAYRVVRDPRAGAVSHPHAHAGGIHASALLHEALLHRTVAGENRLARLLPSVADPHAAGAEVEELAAHGGAAFRAAREHRAVRARVRHGAVLEAHAARTFDMHRARLVGRRLRDVVAAVLHAEVGVRERDAAEHDVLGAVDADGVAVPGGDGLAGARRLAGHRHVEDLALRGVEVPVAGLAERGAHVVEAVPAVVVHRLVVAREMGRVERDAAEIRLPRGDLRARDRPDVEHAHLHVRILPRRELALPADEALTSRGGVRPAGGFNEVVACARQERTRPTLSVHVELRKPRANRHARVPPALRVDGPVRDSPSGAHDGQRPRRGLEDKMTVRRREDERLGGFVRAVGQHDPRTAGGAGARCGGGQRPERRGGSARTCVIALRRHMNLSRPGHPSSRAGANNQSTISHRTKYSIK